MLDSKRVLINMRNIQIRIREHDIVPSECCQPTVEPWAGGFHLGTDCKRIGLN